MSATVASSVLAHSDRHGAVGAIVSPGGANQVGCRPRPPGGVAAIPRPPENIAEALQRDPDDIKVVVNFGG